MIANTNWLVIKLQRASVPLIQVGVALHALQDGNASFRRVAISL